MNLGDLLIFDFLPEPWQRPVAGLSVLVVSILLARLVRRVVRGRIKPHTRNPLAADFLGQFVGTAVVFMGVLAMLRLLGHGNVISTLLAGAGILAFVIGFAFKDIGENFLAGIMLALKSPFRINDLIETGGITGRVRELNLRETRVKCADGRDVFIPNGQILKSPLTNFTMDGHQRQEFTVGVGYGTDLPALLEALKATVQGVPGVNDGNRAPAVLVDRAATSTVELKVLFWVNTTAGGAGRRPDVVRSEAIIAALDLLARRGVDMPADIVEVKKRD